MVVSFRAINFCICLHFLIILYRNNILLWQFIFVNILSLQKFTHKNKLVCITLSLMHEKGHVLVKKQGELAPCT